MEVSWKEWELGAPHSHLPLYFLWYIPEPTPVACIYSDWILMIYFLILESGCLGQEKCLKTKNCGVPNESQQF